jgi:hypothetical protein
MIEAQSASLNEAIFKFHVRENVEKKGWSIASGIENYLLNKTLLHRILSWVSK